MDKPYLLTHSTTDSPKDPPIRMDRGVRVHQTNQQPKTRLVLSASRQEVSLGLQMPDFEFGFKIETDLIADIWSEVYGGRKK